MNAGKTWTSLAWASLGMHGWCAALSGALLPEIISAFGLSSSFAGAFVAVPAVGFTNAVLAGGLLTEVISLQRLLALSTVGLALSLGLAAAATAPTILIVAALGIGFSRGLLETSGNSLISNLYPGNAARELNLLHVFFGIGAFISPLFVATLLTVGVVWRGCYAIAMAPLVILAVILARQPTPAHLRATRLDLGILPQLMRQPAILFAWAALFLLSASEHGLSGWLVTYLRQAVFYSPQLAGFALSTFWLAIIVGRCLNSRLPSSWSEITVITIEALGGTLAILMILHSAHTAGILLGVALTGLFMAGQLPALLSYAGKTYPQYIGSISGVVLSGGGMGFLLGPALIGIVADVADLTLAMHATAALLAGVAVI